MTRKMAGAGMLTVTNTWANKTPARLKEISANFIPVEATVDGVADGLLAHHARDAGGRAVARDLRDWMPESIRLVFA